MLRILFAKSFRPTSLSSQIQTNAHFQQCYRTATTSSTQLEGGAAPRKNYRARQKERLDQRQQQQGDAISSTLEWEKFDFSDSPKWDKRFDEDNLLHLPSNEESFKEIENRETQEDIKTQKRFEREHQVWETLDPQLVEDATEILRPFIGDDRWSRIETLLQKRTQQTRFMFENPSNPSNAWACLRTLDSFGIQHVDVVIQSGQYKGKAALSQKRGMRTAMGSAKWLTLKNHLSTEHALEELKKEDYHILCTDVNPSSKDIRDVDWDASGKKLCIVMGNEQYGISDKVKEMADESFYLPMVGMAESFNLSVATAITCAHLSAASSHGEGNSPTSGHCEEGKGPLRFGDLSEKEFKTLLLKGALNSIKPKTATALFRQKGLEFPKDLNLS